MVSNYTPEEVAKACWERAYFSRGEWRTMCPGHKDVAPSATVGSGSKRDVIMKCHAGCPPKHLYQSLKDVHGIDLMAQEKEKDQPRERASFGRIVDTTDYTDENGNVLFQSLRYDPKNFRQRALVNGNWVWRMQGVRLVLWNLPAIVEARKEGGTILVVEGEKDAKNLTKLGFVATTNVAGANKWRAEYTESLKGARVVVIPDNDERGLDHGKLVATSCFNAGIPVRMLMLPGLPDKGDVSDWLMFGGTAEKLIELCSKLPDWKPEAAAAREAASVTLDPDGYFDTDLSNVYRFMKRHGNDVKSTNAVGWVDYNGKYWERDPRKLRVMRRAVSVVRDIQKEVAVAPEHQRDDLAKWAKKSQSFERVRALVGMAETQQEVEMNYTDFDSDDMLINCQNGTIDLRTGEMREHRREDYISRIIPVTFDPRATCPTWDAFIARAMDNNTEMIAYLHRLMGYWLTGSTKEQSLSFHFGEGANGKSIFLELNLFMLGMYGTNTRAETFMQQQNKSSIPNDVARLAGARFVAVNETSKGQKFDEGLIKDATGCDTMTARFLNHEFFDFRPKFKIAMRGNHKPRLTPNDYGIARRVRFVPWAVTIPEKERNQNLAAELRAEVSGIFNRALDGCREWQFMGEDPPQIVRAFTASSMEEMDNFAHWLSDECATGELLSINAQTLYDNYVGWCKRNGHFAFSSTQFKQELLRRGFTQPRYSSGLRWKGIALRGYSEEPDYGQLEIARGN